MPNGIILQNLPAIQPFLGSFLAKHPRLKVSLKLRIEFPGGKAFDPDADPPEKLSRRAAVVRDVAERFKIF
ncbi:MAG: hypothetical protein BWY44_00729 [Candidatus Omnitrophica bacterium ADurb.Bin292]|nr:MAG: hypothetical protein BWY44_00729 [Candidatus Omnitrophica bacterium ADurb.Bin292]